MVAVGMSMLIIGTLANSRSRKSCAMFNRRFLSIGGIMCFIHGLFTVPYYVSATATRREEEKIKENASQSVRRTWSSTRAIIPSVLPSVHLFYFIFLCFTDYTNCLIFNGCIFNCMINNITANAQQSEGNAWFESEREEDFSDFT